MARTRRAGLDDTTGRAEECRAVAAHRARWAQPVSQYVSDYWFIRGFVELVTVDAEAVAIAESAYLRNLEWLDLSSNKRRRGRAGGIGGVGEPAQAGPSQLPLERDR